MFAAEAQPLLHEKATTVRGHWWLFIAVALLAIAVRLIVWRQLSGSPVGDLVIGDGAAYDIWARQIAAGDWFGDRVFYQAPLYPYFLAGLYKLFAPGLATVRLAQIACDALSCVLLMLASARLFDRRIALTAGSILALYPTSIFASMLVQKTSLEVLLLTASLAAIVTAIQQPRVLTWLVSGLTLGLLGLTRENALLLVALTAAWPVIALRHGSRRDRAASAAAVLLGAVLVIAPVTVRNYIVSGGEFHITTSQLGPNLYIGNHAGATGSYTPLKPGRGSAEFERLDATDLAQRATGGNLTDAGVSAYWTQQAITFITHEPGAWVQLMLRKTLLLLNDGEMTDTDDQNVYAEFSPLLRAFSLPLHAGVVLALAAAGAVLTWRQRRGLVLLAMMTVYAASVIAFYVVARYRFPLLVMAMPLSAAAVVMLLTAIRRLDWPRLIGPVVAAGCVGGLALLPLVSREQSMAVSYYNLGVVANDRGQVDRAIDWYERALTLNPAYVDAHNNLGVALADRGHIDEACTHFRTALTLCPTLVEAYENLGNTLTRMGKFADAAHAYRRAVELEPAHWETEVKLARIARHTGDVGEAIARYKAALRHLPPDSWEARQIRDTIAKLSA
jgi:tetratricopeptide (TPR) repeat protein